MSHLEAGKDVNHPGIGTPHQSRVFSDNAGWHYVLICAVQCVGVKYYFHMHETSRRQVGLFQLFCFHPVTSHSIGNV